MSLTESRRRARGSACTIQFSTRRARLRLAVKRGHRAQSSPLAYTLLEVLLSLVLTSLVLLCVAMAIDFQLRIADAGRTRVEEAQLARVLLHRIADDIRSAVMADPLGLAELTAQQGGSTAAGQSSETAADETDAPDEADTPDEAESTTEEPGEEMPDGSGDSTDSLVPHAVPGIYGDAEWLQVDIGRPTRARRPAELTSEEDLTLSPTGDLKTVAYYVAAADDSVSLDATEPSGGLVRRELDRAVTAWASEQGSVEQLQVGETPIAPEVESILFRYSDGVDWYEAWDMEENGGLPRAVEITLGLRPVRQNGNWTGALADATGLSSSSEEEVLVYRLIVDVPMARTQSSGAATEESESGETDMLDTESSSAEEETP